MKTYKQDLFYANIPVSKNRNFTNPGYLKNYLIKKSFMKDVKNPYFIWTGTGRIEKLEKMLLTTKTRNKIRKSKLQFHFYLYEPLCARVDEYNQSFYSEFNGDVDLSQIISDELESIRIFVKNNQIEKFQIFTSDYKIQLIQKNYPDLKLNCLDLFLREINNSNHTRITGEDKKESIEKKFWCGNWRYTPHRHLITSYLVNIDSGIYSWNLKCSFEDLKKNIWFDLDRYREIDHNRFELIRKGIDILNENIFSIDTQIEQIEITNYTDVYIPGHSSPPKSEQFLDSYKKCFCAIINETRYAQPFGYFSEKTITAIDLRMPVILVAPPRTLEYLKTFGFKTFDKWWDESYDIEEDHEKRLIKIFDVIDFIKNKSLNELKKMYDEMHEILEHNISVCKTIPYNDNFL